MKKETETNLRILRTDPLKMNIRVWFDYLKVALKWNGKLGYHKTTPFQFQINKEYYRAWNLNQVRTLLFDKWWKTHEHLFSDKNYVSVRVLDSLSVEDAFKEVKKQLIKKVGIDVIPVCVDGKVGTHKWLLDYVFLPDAYIILSWNQVFHEAIGALVYKIMGYT